MFLTHGFIFIYNVVEDSVFPGFPHRIPKRLALLRGLITSKDGLNHEGIFREKGNDNEVQLIQEKIRKGLPFKSNDIYAAATCIKVCEYIWFGVWSSKGVIVLMRRFRYIFENFLKRL